MRGIRGLLDRNTDLYRQAVYQQIVALSKGIAGIRRELLAEVRERKGATAKTSSTAGRRSGGWSWRSCQACLCKKG